MPKGTYWAEVTSNSEKTKPVALAFINDQADRQLVSRKFLKKFFHSNMLEVFRVILKALFGYPILPIRHQDGIVKLVEKSKPL